MDTKDIGILIRDRLEGDVVCEIDWADENLTPIAEHDVVFVDVSDANNPIIHTSNGNRFICRIIKA